MADVNSLLEDGWEDGDKKDTVALPRVQLSNGKWQCSHSCTGGFTKKGKPCSHKCCREGVQNARKAKSSFKRPEKGEIATAPSVNVGQTTTSYQPLRRPAEPFDENRNSKRRKTESRSQLTTVKPDDLSGIECIDLSMLDDNGDDDFAFPDVGKIHQEKRPEVITKASRATAKVKAQTTVEEGDNNFDESLFDDMDSVDINKLMAGVEHGYSKTLGPGTNRSTSEETKLVKDAMHNAAKHRNLAACPPAENEAACFARTWEPSDCPNIAEEVGSWDADFCGGGEQAAKDWQSPSTLDAQPAPESGIKSGQVSIGGNEPAIESGKEPVWLGDIDPQVVDMLRGYVNWSEEGF